MRKYLKDRYALVLLSILFIAVVAIPRISYPDLDHGDEFSDASVLMSGRNFVKFGFIRCRFLPVAEPHLAAPKDPYTHAPAMADITNGLLRKIFKTDSLELFRGVALFFSLLNLLFWYIFVKKFSGSFTMAFLAALFYLTNPYFIYGADSLYQNAYSDLLRSVIFCLFLWVLIYPRIRKYLLGLLFLVFALQTAYTFEYIVYTGIFMLGFRYFYISDGKIFRFKYIFLLSLAPLLIIALHLLQNAWYFGSFNLAYQDLRNIAVERITHSKDSPFGALTLGNWWNHVAARYISLAFIFNFHILVPFAVFFYLLYRNLDTQSRAEVRRVFFLCLLLLLCGISWYVIFPSHALAHTFIPFLPRHLVPAAALSFALCCYIIVFFLKRQERRNISGGLILALFVIAVSLSGLLKSELPIFGERLHAARDFLGFKQCLLSIRSTPEDKETLGVNYYRYPFIRYYTERKCEVVFNKAALEALPSLPGYFVLMLQNNQSTFELYQSLQEKYTMLSECRSARFPGMLFKLKR